MKKITFLLFVTILTCFSLTGCGEKLKISDLNRKLANAEEQINNLEQDIEKYEIEKYDYLNQIDSLNEEIRTLTANLEMYSETSSNSSSYLDEYSKNLIDEQNNQIKKLQEQIAQLTNSQKKYSSENITPNQYLALQNEINVLKNELQNYKTVSATLQQQLNDQIALNKHLQNSSNSSSYLNIKFWTTDYTYYCNNVTWYSEANCINKISEQDNIIISSPIVSKDELSNGYIVYTCMSNYGLIYSPYRPTLKENK